MEKLHFTYFQWNGRYGRNLRYAHMHKIPMRLVNTLDWKLDYGEKV